MIKKHTLNTEATTKASVVEGVGGRGGTLQNQKFQTKIYKQKL